MLTTSGDPCETENDCDGQLICRSGACASIGATLTIGRTSTRPPTIRPTTTRITIRPTTSSTPSCEWAGHCTGMSTFFSSCGRSGSPLRSPQPPHIRPTAPRLSNTDRICAQGIHVKLRTTAMANLSVARANVVQLPRPLSPALAASPLLQ